MITPTQHEKNEWARMAQAAYAVRDNFMGHRYSAYASLSTRAHITVAEYDGLMINYRRWLTGDLKLAP